MSLRRLKNCRSMSKPTPSPTRPLLLIDDDVKLCRLITMYLTPLGYTVTCVHDGREGAERAVGEVWHAVILDMMLPTMDGFEVLQFIRRTSAVPILMLTARGEEADRIVGLECGADDYLPKTFSTRELLARLRAVTRRVVQPQRKSLEKEEPDVVVGRLRLNVASRSACLGDQPLALTPVEFDLLLALARCPGRVKSRDQLLAEIRARDYEIFDRSIDVHISGLRKKLGDDARRPNYLKTVRSAGYLMNREAK